MERRLQQEGFHFTYDKALYDCLLRRDWDGVRQKLRGDPDYQELISDLLEGSTEFAAIWARQDVRGRREALKRFNHSELGRFDLEFTSFQVAEQPSLRLALYTPADDGHSERTVREVVAAQLVSSSGR